MPKIKTHEGYKVESDIPKPSVPVQPNIVTVQDGVPIKYRKCDGVGVRVVHPKNPHAPSNNMSVVVFFLPPFAKLPVSSHHTEECYLIQYGKGIMTLAGKEYAVEAGDFIHLPAWCEHGIENTGVETLEILIVTSPPNP